MSIINKIKATIKKEIVQRVSAMPIADLRSILAPRGALIFENERESHLHTLSLLHGAMRRDFFADDVTRWREDFGHRGEAIRYLSNTNSSRSWSFDVYSAASVTLLRDLYIPNEDRVSFDPDRIDELDDAVQALNARHGTDFVIVDGDELSQPCPHCKTLNGEIEMLCQLNNDKHDEIRDLKKELASSEELLGHSLDREARLINENVDLIKRCGALAENLEELQGELDKWHSLGNNLEVSDVEEKLELLEEWEDLISISFLRDMEPSEIGDKLDLLEEWEDVIGLGWSPSEVEEKIEMVEELEENLARIDGHLETAGDCLREARGWCHTDKN